MAQDPRQEYHRPVLVDEVVGLIAPTMPGLVVDATFGGGGHTRRLLEEFGDRVRVVAIDRDPDALARAADLGIDAVQGNFADLEEMVSSVTDEAPTAVLFDFGVSSHQVDTAERGFSYRHDGPLDMRMGPDAPYTAAEIVNEWPEAELARIIRRYGEEPQAGRIASAIVTNRPFETTGQLSTVIAAAVPPRRAGHPARRTFQALRIAVNGEIEAVEAGLEQAISMVRPGGRIVAISYHSLEDRVVKQRFARGATGCVCPPGLPVCACGRAAELRVLTRKPVKPSPAEVAGNRRARSAVLRAAEKVAA
ncbi:MAG: 16S rRNA (cytosine(1402)-N(4))-methyltransferase RsmH [Acidimicrobiales bacterium]|jgi:16S rRNA (cytosine1402-N4)-methyltransferase|nr:16S rRNA (cytosine(1402)-N(4))-methyltransferase RsmH [Acidimicrobiales bacterium]HLV90191.1 16S rRNA (cytosine(1402)-N(4))-methyltransferase RsmH [Acidimicrobiia bacterium]